MPNEELFQQTLLETVETALVQVLGEKVTGALRFYVDMSSALKNPDRFMAVMFELVGPRQTEALRNKILEGLQTKLGVQQRPEGVKFSEQLSKLKSETG
jgi:hypothetical protein